MKRILFIADSHLSGGNASETAFFHLLDRIGNEPDCGVVFLGDIFDLWLALPGYEQSGHRRFLQWCREQKPKRFIGFIEGNHEFYISSSHREAFSEVTDTMLRIGGNQVLAFHGDTVNRQDLFYLLLRFTVRNRLFRFLTKLAGRSFGPRLAGRIRTGLKGTNMRQKRVFPEKALQAFVKRSGCRFAAAGHFHRSAQLGNLTVLPPWTAPDYTIGLYEPDPGTFRTVRTKELFGESWNSTFSV